MVLCTAAIRGDIVCDETMRIVNCITEAGRNEYVLYFIRCVNTSLLIVCIYFFLGEVNLKVIGSSIRFD